jgi:hypothetical protein
MPDAVVLVAKIQSDLEYWQQQSKEVARLCQQGNPSAAEQYTIAKITPLYSDLAQSAIQLEESNRSALATKSQNIADRQIMWVGAIALLIFGGCMGTFLFVTSRMTWEVPAAESHDAATMY